MKRIAVFVSGGGTNLQALIDAQKRGEFPGGELVLVVASNQNAYALTRAAQNGISTAVVSRRSFSSPEEFDAALTRTLEEAAIDLVVLAGYLSILSQTVTRRYANRIINIHPALIPSFCGPGFYGLHVHEAALARGVKITGATTHFVNEICDGGPIIEQLPVSVLPEDTPEILQRRVMEQAEWRLLPHAVALYCSGRLFVQNGKAVITQ